MKIGGNLQAVLQARGVAPESVREALGWDRDTLDRVLADRLSPGISELLRLATFLGVGISELLGGAEQIGKKAVKTGAGERVGVDRKNFLHYESLASAFAGRHLEPFVVEVYRGAQGNEDVSRHAGEEFLFLLSGELQVTVAGEEFRLEAGDSLYFDSQLPHALSSLGESCRLVAVIYKGASMLQLTKGHGMKSVIEAARLVQGQSLVLVCPDATSLRAVNKGIEEGILETAYLVGNRACIEESCGRDLLFPGQYRFVDLEPGGEYEREAARIGVELIRSGAGDMLMKGGLKTAVIIKAALAKEEGIGTGRRLSNVSIFELPGVERLVFLTDPAINPELFAHAEAASGVDIIDNAIEVARALGVERPKVALLEANEVPSEKIPTTLLEQTLSKREWEGADVSGPLSYDLALYPEAVAKKGMVGNPVAGRADILVVPHISGGNFLYKSWVFTMGAEVANVVLGASAPIILTSRSDSDLTKFLTICASALYSHFLRGKGKGEKGLC
ncbi:phosphate acyltransferase [Citrifermentans bremense]|uniref:phosphate acyltransferase n=1 Tax=Citrifermentans bremense TaxID=60035 RepID=UPI0004028232|nr:phosphate acyltransferase [Citrifermentans bremense]